MEPEAAQQRVPTAALQQHALEAAQATLRLTDRVGPGRLAALSRQQLLSLRPRVPGYSLAREAFGNLWALDEAGEASLLLEVWLSRGAALSSAALCANSRPETWTSATWTSSKLQGCARSSLATSSATRLW